MQPRGDPCGTDTAPPPRPNLDPWVRGHPLGDFISSSLVQGPAFLNPLVVAPFSLLLQISAGWARALGQGPGPRPETMALRGRCGRGVAGFLILFVFLNF